MNFKAKVTHTNYQPQKLKDNTRYTQPNPIPMTNELRLQIWDEKKIN